MNKGVNFEPIPDNSGLQVGDELISSWIFAKLGNLNHPNRRYLYYPSYKDKQINYINKVDDVLNRTVEMFQYDNLPDTITSRNVEMILQTAGFGIFFEHEGEYYLSMAKPHQLGTARNPTNLDPYGEPILYMIDNINIPGLKPYTTYNIQEEEAVLIRNDAYMKGLWPILINHLPLLVEGDITKHVMMINSRAMAIMQADDDNAADTAREYLDNLEKGETSVITSSTFRSGLGLETHEPFNGASDINQIIDLDQYQFAKLWRSLGIPEESDRKRQYVSDSETSGSDLYSMTLIENMLKERERALEKINALYGLNITVKLSSAWEKVEERIELELEELEEIEGGDYDGDTLDRNGEEMETGTDTETESESEEEKDNEDDNNEEERKDDSEEDREEVEEGEDDTDKRDDEEEKDKD